MPLQKFELITRYFRTFDHTNLNVSDKRDLLKTFQAAKELLRNRATFCIKLEVPMPYGKKGKLRTEIPLSNIQSVVVHLLQRLSIATYHVFTDNLFSSPQLFRLLRQLGYGAIGTARPNCGITTVIKQIKETRKLPDGKPLLYNKVYLIPTKDKQV
ncbi:Transcriptional regulatory protein moc3 [Fusarium oxysporum f. sp. albedinis]|nr:Transcriptional regulatory protein moc3 [Fusarium oxysporum f. sp. albedinis]